MVEESLPESESPSASHLSTKRNFEGEFFHLIEKKKQKTPIATTLESSVNGELSLYERHGQLGPILKNVLFITQTIRPTTTDCERVFSLAGNFCTKHRTRMSDDTLNTLVFLKSYFLTINSSQ